MSPVRRKELARQRRRTAAIATASTIACAAYAAASVYHLTSIRRRYRNSLLSGPA